MEKLVITNLELKGKRLFIRADFNVPLDADGKITDDTRIRAVLPTVNYALEAGAKIILASHLGRPQGADPKFSLAPVARRLSLWLGREVTLLPDCVGEEVEERVRKMRPGEVVLLENLRFHAGEGKNDDAFSKQLASLAEVYVNDAFATAHRCHASNVGITRHLPCAAAGFLLRKEVDYFSKAMQNPKRPMVAILGGAKVSDKIGAVRFLLQRVDKIIIGGGMAFTFLKAQGVDVGRSLVDEALIPEAIEAMRIAKERNVKFYLPVDCVAAEKIDISVARAEVPVQEIPSGWLGLDIGRASVTLFSEALADAKTIIWNGPMGVFELEPFGRGTSFMARMVADATAIRALSIVGGGDTDVIMHQEGLTYSISYMSTGGGAFLELLKGKNLPGVEALTDKAAAPQII